MTRLDPRDMYLDLLRSYLTRYGEDELVLIRAESHPVVRRVFGILAKRNIRVVRAVLATARMMRGCWRSMTAGTARTGRRPRTWAGSRGIRPDPTRAINPVITPHVLLVLSVEFGHAYD